MSVYALFYLDFAEAGRRYRLEGYPASALKYPATINVPAWGAAPGTFDGDSSGDNCYVQIPKRAVYSTTTTEASFDKQPINFPSPAGMRLAFKLNYLNGGQLDTLKTCILDPESAGGGTFTYDGPSGEDFTTSTTWVLKCDMGVSTAAVTDFTVVFAGAQRRLPTRKGQANKKTGLKKIEIEVQHLSRMCYEVITPAVLRAELMTATYKNVEGPDSEIADSYYVKNNKAYSHVQKSTTNYAYHFRLIDLSQAIMNLAADAYASYMRADPADVIFTHLSPKAVPANGEAGGPLDNLTFYEQTYDGDGDHGGAIALADLYFLAVITDDTTYDTGNEYGGYISDVGKDPIGIYKYKNAYDWLRDACETGHCKVIWQQIDPLTVHVHFLREKDSTPTTGPLSLVAEDFYGETVDFEQGANVIVGAAASIPGAGGGDESSPSYRNPDFGILAEEEASIAVVLHGNPSIGDDGAVDFGVTGSGAFASSAGGAAVESIGFITNRLAYRASFGGNPMIRPHHYVKVHDGITDNAYCVDAIGLPGPSAFSTGDDNNGVVKSDFWVPLQAVYIAAQQAGGAPFAVAKRATIAFGHQKQTLYEGEVPLEKGTIDMLGNTCDATDWPNASIFEKTGSDYADIPGAPTVLSLETDYKAGKCKIKLLAQGS